MRRTILFILVSLPGFVFADRLGSLNSNAQVSLTTQSIQNTLTPTTTTQQFSVQVASVSTNLYSESSAFMTGNGSTAPLLIKGFGGYTPFRIQNNTGKEKFAVDNAGNIEIAGVNYTWPTTQGTGSLANNGSGNLSWSSSGASGAAGGLGDVQYNDGLGNFTASAAHNFNYTDSVAQLVLGCNTGANGQLMLVSNSGSFNQAFSGSSMYTIVWPTAQGAGSLVNDGSGNLSWVSSDASSVPYTPATPSNWAGSPTTVQQALDRMAALLYTLNGNTAIP